MGLGEMIGGLVALTVAVVGALGWIFKLHGDNATNRDRIMENVKLIEKVDVRVEKLENRHDQVSNEMRSMLYGIQRSISNIEGRLSINSKGE